MPGHDTRRVFCSAGVAFALVASGVRGATWSEGNRPMSDFDPGAPSAILRATHIIAIRIDAAAPAPWATNAAGWNERHVALGAMLMRTLKGTLSETAGSRFSARITQFENPSPVSLPIPGIWSDVEVAAGTELLVFSVSAQPIAPPGSLLDDPPCIRVIDAVELPSVVLMLRYLRGEIPARSLLAARPGEVFVELLDELLRRPDFIAYDVFLKVLTVMEDASLPATIRAGMIAVVMEAPGNSALYTDWHLDQVVIALLRVGLDPRSGDLADNILSIDMPSLVGLNGGEPRSATQVFHDEPTLRRQFLGLARAPGARPAAKKLIGWLSKD